MPDDQSQPVRGRRESQLPISEVVAETSENTAESMRRPNQRDLVAHYARRIELSSQRNPTHTSWPQETDLSPQDEWAPVKLVQFGRPMPEAIPNVTGETTDPIEFVMPPQAGKMSLLDRGSEFLGHHIRRFIAIRLATVQHGLHSDRPDS